MNPKLAALLAFAATVTAGGITASLYTPSQDVTMADLLDAGMGRDCVRRDVTVNLDPDHSDDGGYQRKKFDVAVCAPGDGGTVKDVILPRKVALQMQTTGWAPSAPSASTLGLGGESVAAHECACAVDATCLLSDAGTAYVASGANVLAPGSFISSASCVPCPCVILAGRPFAAPAGWNP